MNQSRDSERLTDAAAGGVASLNELLDAAGKLCHDEKNLKKSIHSENKKPD